MPDLIAVADAFALNDVRAQDQTDARIVGLSNGGFIAVWRDNLASDGQSPGAYRLIAQRYDASGNLIGDEFRVDSVAGGLPFNHDVILLADGRVVVAWEDAASSSIRARVVAADGTAVGSELLLASGAQFDVAVAALPNGGFVATWSDASANATDVRGQLFSAAGVATSSVLTLNSVTAGTQGSSDVIALPGGGFVVVWQDASGTGGDADATSIKGRRFDAGGQPIGDEFLVNSSPTGNQGTPSIALLDNGRFVVTWLDSTNGGPGVVEARLFDGTGAALGAEFAVSEVPGPDEALPTVVAVRGGFLVSWAQGITSGDANVHAQLFTNDGARVGSEDLVNTTTFGNQSSPALAVLASGQVVAAWSDDNGTSRAGLTINDLRARIFYDPAGVLTGTEGGEAIAGFAGSDVISALGGNDTLTGGDGDDYLIGGAGADTVDGGAGNDRILYDAADVASQVTGGAGNDVLLVQGEAAPRSFNLIAQGFEAAEVTQWDQGNNPWSSIVQIYNGNWDLVQQTTVNDDGLRTLIQLDPANQASTNQVWSVFDSQNRLSSIDQLFDNGTRTFINVDENNSQIWRQDWFNYDAQGRLDSEDVIYDIGTRTFINFDQANTQSWSQDWFTYDAQGRLDSEDVLYDNGTRTFINVDQDNTQSWRQDWFTYDAQGRLDSEDVLYDNGTRTFIDLDQANSQPWSQAWFAYDAQGRLDTQDVFYDNGTRLFTNHDQANTEVYAYRSIQYDASGNATQYTTVFDDGRVSYDMF